MYTTVRYNLVWCDDSHARITIHSHFEKPATGPAGRKFYATAISDRAQCLAAAAQLCPNSSAIVSTRNRKRESVRSFYQPSFWGAQFSSVQTNICFRAARNAMAYLSLCIPIDIVIIEESYRKVQNRLWGLERRDLRIDKRGHWSEGLEFEDPPRVQ